MKYEEYAQRFWDHRGIIDVNSGVTLAEGDSRYSLLSAAMPGRRTLLITAGFHGDETSGPLTLLEHLPAIVAYARSRNVGLQIYPCLNPSGFSDNTRYNRSGESPNNDFLRYEVGPETWADVLKSGQQFTRWEPHRGGPKETRALLAELEQAPLPHAALDLHQDPWLEGALAYAYVLGPRAPYLPLIATTAAVVPIAREALVDEDDGVRTDGDGIIEQHDGSVTDYLHRKKVPFTAALETTTRTPPELSDQVNLIWIRGFIDLAGRA